MRRSSADRATIASSRCLPGPGRGSLINSHRPSSGGTFCAATPRSPLFARWIEAKAAQRKIVLRTAPVHGLIRGPLIPRGGPWLNLCGRPPDAAWLPGAYLPSVGELARHLAERFDYPRDETLDLVRVSEYAFVMSGSGPLYEELHQVFDADYAISPLHRFLAGLPRGG